MVHSNNESRNVDHVSQKHFSIILKMVAASNDLFIDYRISDIILKRFEFHNFYTKK